MGTEQLLKIDGKTFGVMLIKISRSASILDKYAKRTINGDLHREIIGTYYNYSLEFVYNDEPLRYALLWERLTAPEAFHYIQIVDTVNIYSFEGYISNVKDSISYASPNNGYERRFDGLSCDIVAKTPSRRP
jgi:hypothetical protein